MAGMRNEGRKGVVCLEKLKAGPSTRTEIHGCGAIKKSKFQEGVGPGCELVWIWHMGSSGKGENVPTILGVPVDGGAQEAAESERRSSAVA